MPQPGGTAKHLKGSMVETIDILIQPSRHTAPHRKKSSTVCGAALLQPELYQNFLKFFCKQGNDLKQVANDTVVSNL
ncbi:hypothetical protein, partial [Aneurinibacillus aneurinilyticus]|uniref:hypothetical protein n=1 Tax=Aneurinibacillus aneurinilyticus TaxID=1391 RepID=UPI0023F30F00